MKAAHDRTARRRRRRTPLGTGSRTASREVSRLQWDRLGRPKGEDPTDGIPDYALLAGRDGGSVQRDRGGRAPPGGLPEGQIYHAAGPTDGGILITAVWDSKEQADRFIREKLMASMPVAGGFVGQPEERAAEIVNLLKA